MKTTNVSSGLHGFPQPMPPPRLPARGNEGFGLVDVVIGIMLMSILAGMAVISMNTILPGMRTEKAMHQVVAQLRQGRQLAIAQRRNIQLEFRAEENEIRLLRVEEPSGDTTAISTAKLDSKCAFTNPDHASVDTPDGFGNDAAIDFGGAASLTFSSQGILVDESGDPVSGTVFFGLADDPDKLCAVTILGATGRIRSYRWTGDMWAH